MLLDDILHILRNGGTDKAYTVQSRSYSYTDLYKFTCNLYSYLLAVNPDRRPVIVYGHKDVYMKAAFLACSFAGMAYVPTDMSTPKARTDAIAKQVRPGVIIGDMQLDNCHCISAEQCITLMRRDSAHEIEKILLKPEDIYYIIFTSGSTGEPKGVKVTYNNVDSCMAWLTEITKLKKGVILNQADFSFDASVADLYLSLLTGSEHFIPDAGAGVDLSARMAELGKSGATAAVLTPSFADLLLLDRSFCRDVLPKLELILFCGESLHLPTVKKLRARFGGIRMINCYGPTECTFSVTAWEAPEELPDGEIPIGYPKKDTDIYIVDDSMCVLPEGEVGEIVIAGDSVADGYLGGGDDRAFMTYNGKRAYATGDLGYRRDDVLYYKCRKDKQIKFKGYRIEPADIERNICAVAGIEKAVVLPKRAPDGRVTRLIAFVKPYENVRISAEETAQALKQRLPAYMCPDVKLVRAFPINKNGKCDEKRLLESL